jgi:hypothetical protein
VCGCKCVCVCGCGCVSRCVRARVWVCGELLCVDACVVVCVREYV